MVSTINSSLFFIDSHCHLDFPEFDADRQELWQRARQSGVQGTVIPGVFPDQWTRAKKISLTLENVFFSAGVHPWWIDSLFEGIENVTDLLKEVTSLQRHSFEDERCVAVGECGLDSVIRAPVERQKQVFDAQLALAAEIDKPVIVHCRKAHNEVLAAIKASGVKRGVIHAFSGSVELAQQYYALGFSIGIGGTITYDRAKKTRDAVKKLPLEAIILETDAPDMPLHGRQGARNSPEYVADVARTLVALRNESVEEIARVTSENTCRLFNLSLLSNTL